MSSLPILCISRTKYLADSSKDTLINIDNPSDVIHIKRFPKEIMPVEVIYFDEKRQQRYYPKTPGAPVPEHISLYKFPRLEELAALPILQTEQSNHTPVVIVAEKFRPVLGFRHMSKQDKMKRNCGIRRHRGS